MNCSLLLKDRQQSWGGRMGGEITVDVSLSIMASVQAWAPEVRSPALKGELVCALFPQCLGAGKRSRAELPEAHWPASLVKKVSFKFCKKCCLKKQKWTAIKG